MAKLDFAVIGKPIDHSMSPQIHHFFAEQFNFKDYKYKKILSTKEDLGKTVQDFFRDGGSGLNITVPFKVDAYNLCDTLDETAIQCGSVNTLKNILGKIKGYNTDGQGFIDDLMKKNVCISNSRILILGAGGSAMSIANSLLRKSRESKISVLNRTMSRAERLVDFFSNGNLEIHRTGSVYDLVINTTPISMSGDKMIFPNDIVRSSTTCYDLFYSKRKTTFQEWSHKNGIKICYDGLGMLIEQAKHSFEIWNNKTPDIGNLEEQLRLT
jgi:shikimate dehydrogenase